MGYYTAFGLGIVLMYVSVVGHDVFPAWFNLHGNGGSCRTRTGYQFDGVRAVGGSGWPVIIIRRPAKSLDSSLLIYGDAFVALPPVSVCAAVVVRSGRRMAGNAGFPRAAVFVRLLPVVRREKRRPYKMQHFSARR